VVASTKALVALPLNCLFLITVVYCVLLYCVKKYNSDDAGNFETHLLVASSWFYAEPAYYYTVLVLN